MITIRGSSSLLGKLSTNDRRNAREEPQGTLADNGYATPLVRFYLAATQVKAYTPMRRIQENHSYSIEMATRDAEAQ